MRIVICDDAPEFLDVFGKQVRSELQKRNMQAEIITCQSGLALLQEVVKAPTDAIFLDIDMPEINGFETAERLAPMENRPLLIFTTSMDEMVYRSFEYAPFDYLRKTALTELPRIVNRIVETLEKSQRYYEIPIAGRYERIPLSEILYFDVSEHYVTLHKVSGVQEKYKSRLSDIEAQICNSYFVRCHASFLVNCRFIKMVDKSEIILLHGEHLPISRNRLSATQIAFSAYMRSQRI